MIMVQRGFKGVAFLVLVTLVTNTAWAFDRDAFIKCSRMFGFCETAERKLLISEQLKAAATCRRTDMTVSLSTQCARDPDIGAYCSETLFYVGDAVQLLTECNITLIQSGMCPANCSMQLQALRDSLGCCINAVFNRTDSPYADFFLPYFSYTVWRTCNVTPITTTCTGMVPFNLPDFAKTSPNCSYSERLSSNLKQSCVLRGQLMNNELIQSSQECTDYLEYNYRLCSVDHAGHFCVVTPTPNSDYAEYINVIIAACTSTSNCSRQCQQALQYFATNRGCCVNAIYNSTYTEAVGVNYSFLKDTSLFELCGVEPPPKNCSEFLAIGTDGAIQTLKRL